MIADVRVELRKLLTIRLWWAVPLLMAGYMAFIAAVMAFSLAFSQRQLDSGGSSDGVFGSNSTPLSAVDLALSVYTLAPSLGYIFPALLGAFVVTAEFRHRTITPTLLAEPRRGVVLWSKLISVVPFALLVGLAGTLSTVGVGALTLRVMGEPAMLGEPEVRRAVAASVAALTVWALVGVGFGAVLTNQVAVIVVLLAFTQFVEPVLRLVLAQFEATESLGKFLPGAAGEAIAGASFYSTAGIADLLTSWQGALVLGGYAVALMLIGQFTTFRRDIG